jgi:two-component system sensor histidine kinase YesM
VIDDGLGIRLETLTQIRASLEEDSVYPEHIGLFNINKRLKLTYGAEYGILIRSKYGRGTAIYISIPLFGEASTFK